MDNKKNYDEFNFIETNNRYNYENNSVNINDYETSKSRTNFLVLEANKHSNFEIKSKSLRQRRAKSIKLLSSFIVVCAVAAIIQTTFPIPLFTKLFNPPATTITSTPVYTIGSLSSTYNSVSYSITIDNVDDFTSNEYSLMLLEVGNDTDEYIMSIPIATKELHKVIAKSKIVSGKFEKYITKSGLKKITNDKNYVLVLLKNEKIVKKDAISTKRYISSLVFDGVNENVPYGTDGHYKYPSHEKISNTEFADYRYLHVHINLDENFTEFDTLYIKMKNVTSMPYTETGTMFTKEILDLGSYFSPRFDLDAPEQSLQFEIYVSTDDPSKLDYTDSFSPDGTIQYYLIYTYNGTIIF